MRQLLPDGKRQGTAQKARGREWATEEKESCFLEASLMVSQGVEYTSAPGTYSMFRGAGIIFSRRPHQGTRNFLISFGKLVSRSTVPEG